MDKVIFKKKKTFFQGVNVIQKINHTDKRGEFIKLFSKDNLKKIGWNKNIFQINYSVTKKKGTIRGMHYQIGKFKEEKIVTCIKGSLYDVVIDMRKNSPTYLKWFGIILSKKNKLSLHIPENFAHGFQTLEDNTEVIYIHSNYYNPKKEITINPLDPATKIKWKNKIKFMSKKDKQSELL
jgi:dTDP-4-dehydrorhamnose 3,5-epimerase